MLLNLTLLFAYLISLIVSGDEWNGCSWTFTDTNGITVTYDLSDFRLNGKSFQVKDSEVQDDARNYIYLFNICGQIPSNVWNDNSIIIDSCYNTNQNRPCNEWNTTTGNCIHYYNTSLSTPSAIQMEDYNTTQGENRCFWLGVDTDTSSYDYNVSLYDESDSSKGVIYTFADGAYSPMIKTNRELRVELICPDDASYFFDPSTELQLDEAVVEYPLTVYTLSMTSPLACPSNCIAKYNQKYAVCSGKGICATDPYLKQVRCLCDNGYEGDLCDTATTDTLIVSSSDNGLITVIVICLIILGVVVVLSAYLCHKIRLQQKSGNVNDVHNEYFEPMLFEAEPNHVPNTATGLSMNIQPPNQDAPSAPVPPPKQSL